MRLTIVNTHTIAIAVSISGLPRPGINRAHIRAIMRDHTQSKVLSDNTFPTIFSASTFHAEISRIMIAYRPKSARNANIHR